MDIHGKKIKPVLMAGAIAGIIAVFVFRRNLAAEASMLGYFGYISKEVLNAPVSATVVTDLFSNPLAGFIYFDFFDIINVALITIMFIPVLYFCYKHDKRAGITGALLIAGCFCFYIASNQTLALFFGRENIDQLNLILLRSDFCFILGEISVLLLYSFGLFITIIMRRLNIFSGYTFAFGLLTNITGLLYFPAGLVIGELRYLAIVFAAPFTVIWHLNIAANLLKYRKTARLSTQELSL